VARARRSPFIQQPSAGRDSVEVGRRSGDQPAYGHWASGSLRSRTAYFCANPANRRNACFPS